MSKIKPISHNISGLPLLFIAVSFVCLIPQIVTAQATYTNLNFTGPSGWNASVSVPASSTSFLFPDGVSRVPGDFIFKSGVSSIWHLNNNSKVICTQSGANAYNRFFIGSTDGMGASLTFTTGTSQSPGLLCARLSNVAAIRIGENSSNSSGVLKIDGGVRIQTGYIYGEGPSPTIQINNGRLDVFSGNNLKRLNGISVNLATKGQLWILDPNANVTNVTSFRNFVNGANITGPGGNLVFQNNVSVVSALGDTSPGTLITVDTTTDRDSDGLPDAWEIAAQLDPLDNGSIDVKNGPNGDPDFDGLNNLSEYQSGTNPRISDTDQDGLTDGVETNTGILVSATDTGSDPLISDTDMDGISDGEEIARNYDPNDPQDPGIDPDRDRDGIPNTWEIANGLNPDDDGSINSSNGPEGDPDRDGLTNAEEFFLGSDPKSNQFGYAWQQQPLKTDLLVVAAHPDDEGIFFGGTLPYYTQVTQSPVAFICMTSGDYGIPPTVRENQLRQAAWAYGLRNQPLLPRFRNAASSSVNDVWDNWADGVLDGDDVAAGRLRASYYVAGMIRRFRPEVLVTHGAGGEYGHNDHIATSQAVVDAWTIAADPNIEINGLPAWQAKKIYLHEWGTRRLFHDFWENPYAALATKTPRRVAHEGLQFHFNLSTVSTVYLSGEVTASWDEHPSEWWGLYATTVGNDTVVPDFNIAGRNYSGWARGSFLEHITSSDPPPKISCPSPLEASSIWGLVMPAVVGSNSPSASLSLTWSLQSGPGEVTFTPSATVQNPRAHFSKPGNYVLRLTANNGNSAATRNVAVNALPRPLSIVRAINCGGSQFIGRDGTSWQADAFFTGGTAVSISNTRIDSTSDDALFLAQRVGNCSYAIPVENGSYEVTLKFAEIEATKNLPFFRRFHINMENSRVATSLDPYSIAGYARAFERSYSVNVNDGILNLQFTQEVDKPAVSAILVRSITSDPITYDLTNPLADLDGDGISARDEYIGGTSPIIPDPQPLTINPSARTVRLFTRATSGAEYIGLVRRYRIETSSNLQPESWSAVWEGIGDGTWKEVPLNATASKQFVRLVTTLE